MTDDITPGLTVGEHLDADLDDIHEDIATLKADTAALASQIQALAEASSRTWQSLDARLTVLENDTTPPPIEPPPVERDYKPIMSVDGRTWRPRSDSMTNWSGNIPGDGTFAPYLYFCQKDLRAGQGGRPKSVVRNDWDDEGRLANNYVRYHTDRWFAVGTEPPSAVYDILDGYFTHMDPVLSIHNGSETITAGKQFTYGVVMPGLAYSAADLVIVPRGIGAWYDRAKSILDGIPGEPRYRNNHNYRAACINLLAATSTVLDQPVDIVVDHLNDSIIRTFPADDGTVNATEQNRPESIHYDLLELNSFCQAIACVRNRGADINTTAVERLVARADAMWPHYTTYWKKGKNNPFTYQIGTKTRQETGRLFTPANEGPPLEWLIALGFHPGPLPVGAAGHESPFGYTGRVPS